MNLAKMEQVFRDVLAADDDAPVQDFRYGTTPGWTSLAHMQLVSELEDVFDVELDAEEIVTMSDFESAQEVLARHGVTFSA